MRLPKTILFLLAFLFIGSLLGCHGGIRIDKKGDAEAVNGGDTFDIVMGNSRSRLLLAFRRIQNGDALSGLTSAPGDCSGSIAVDLCNASKNLTSEQRDLVVNFLRRNSGRAALITNTKLIPTNDPIVLPNGRTVLAIAGTDSITFNRSVLDLGEASRLALLTHEFSHLFNDVVLGHALTDDETIAGFTSPEGSGRAFADSVGALLTLYAYSGTTAGGAQVEATPAPYSLMPLYKILDHGGSFVAGTDQWGDLNGDGKDDLLYVGTTNVLGPSLSTGDGLGPSRDAGTVPGGAYIPGQIQYADINGDGKIDALYQVTNADNTNTLFQGTSNGTTFGTFVATMRHGGPFVAGEARFADMTGDGLPDYLYQGVDNRVWVSPSVGGIIHAGAGWVADLGDGNDWRGGSNVFYADANGDGKADLLYQSQDNEFRVRYSDGHTFASSQVIVDHGGSFVAGDAFFGDMSLDGRADVLFRGGDYFWLSYSSPGASWYAPGVAVTLPTGSVTGDVLFADMNGDGAKDFIYRGADNVVKIALSKGTTFSELKPYLQITGTRVVGQIKTADLNGDGKQDIIYHNSNNDFWVAFSMGLLP